MASNKPEAIREWAIQALSRSLISPEEHVKLLKAAKEVIQDGGFRGDVCDRWRSMGYGSDKIEDFYP